MRTEEENWGEERSCVEGLCFNCDVFNVPLAVGGVGINFPKMPLNIIGSPGNRCLVPLQYCTTPCALPRPQDPAIAAQGKLAMEP